MAFNLFYYCLRLNVYIKTFYIDNVIKKVIHVVFCVFDYITQTLSVINIKLALIPYLCCEMTTNVFV